jgi:hypothetical protein
MRSPVSELQSCSCDQVHYHPRNKNFARARKGHDARRRMNRDAADILVPDFDFASMEARARWQTDLCGGRFEVQRAADGPTRTIEGG